MGQIKTKTVERKMMEGIGEGKEMGKIERNDKWKYKVEAKKFIKGILKKKNNMYRYLSQR